MLCDVVASVRAWGVREVALVSAHLDPAHLRAVRAAAAKSGARLADLLERENARRLSEEFRQGGPHAGRFETSLVLAARPDAVREDIRQALPSVDVNLGRAIKEGARTFEEAGGSQAYFGDPASASAREGDALFGVLVEILLDALRSGS
jgi:creatinine amidohydrolase